ncbi:MAG TPA: prolyl oligopeptidase family serine peptidase [Phenylobacterium sp.]|jgi:prolyl oligopeptidase|uniref:prolyl oligopeptidase family serine peptidase n=1 Tax=Phenylobacterium sp. TaxID=1871053 RepID=UPI002BE82D6F|nr:prolyl oligopeptidase family serine peptidase [Phenylobacterium sp.]HXA40102.1 prolyl oligopeptidase family serine peptidase [Phenylobacterium sp.]
MKALLAALAALASAAPLALPVQAQTSPPAPAAATADDPFQWLEDIEAPRSMAWVEGQNAKSARRLEGDPRYETFRQQALKIFTAQDRIPTPRFRAGGVDNFWQDATHIHGVWRHTSLASYRAASPQWQTLLDLDALSKAEGKNWIWKGADCLRPAQTLCLVHLSNGGSDAVEDREFDTATGRFVDGGFVFANAKQNIRWIDRDTLIVARPWTPDEVTKSGYAYVVKIVKRGAEPREVFRGAKTDVQAGPVVLEGEHGADAVLINHGLTFYEREFSLLGDKGLTPIPLPRKVEFDTYVDGQAVFTIKQAWKTFAAGDVVSYDLADLKRDAATAKAQLVFHPGPHDAVDRVSSSKDRLAIVLLEDVKGAVDVYDHKAGVWLAKRVKLPANANINLVSASDDDNQMFFTAEGFLDPTSLWLADADSAVAAKVKQLPPQFDASKDVVDQHWAVSTDGTRIPYFVVRPKGMKLDGSTPTQMFGYGGFELSEPPAYIPQMGKLWLERGGAYVIANIRGGGEFGPAWHEAVLREKRQLAFDDFASVARDLEARKITSPRRLGIYARSNGGILTTVSMTQHPELFNAIVIESPLIDMLRYNHLSAGASWVAEYGDPDVPADRAFIARYSGYQNLMPGVKYPEPYITTNTRDDRVHPGHPRKFAAKMEAMGLPYLYYEQTFGGHANDADPQLNATRWARHYVYLSQKLMD